MDNMELEDKVQRQSMLLSIYNIMTVYNIQNDLSIQTIDWWTWMLLNKHLKKALYAQYT